MNTQSRYIRIVTAASDIIKEAGMGAITRDYIAERAEMAPSLLYHYFSSMDELRDALMKLAIDKPDLELLAKGLAVAHPIALKAPPKLRRDAMRLLTREIMGE